ncbi:hypothetical protein NHJ13051_005349, partial [Beauveria bassiana]
MVKIAIVYVRCSRASTRMSHYASLPLVAPPPSDPWLAELT